MHEEGEIIAISKSLIMPQMQKNKAKTAFLPNWQTKENND